MLGPLGFPELLFILVLALLIFGPKRLPEIGRTVGRALGEFRRASHDLKESFTTELALDEGRDRRSMAPTAGQEVPPERREASSSAPPAPETASPAAGESAEAGDSAGSSASASPPASDPRAT